jgi:hypothetical protein
VVDDLLKEGGGLGCFPQITSCGGKKPAFPREGVR